MKKVEKEREKRAKKQELLSDIHFIESTDSKRAQKWIELVKRETKERKKEREREGYSRKINCFHLTIVMCTYLFSVNGFLCRCFR